MRLTKHRTGPVETWAVDGKMLKREQGLSSLLALSREDLLHTLASNDGPPIVGELCAPCLAGNEIWAAGVTYLKSRQEREAESSVADVYARVYEADRPELFFKSLGWRVVGPNEPIRIRRDSTWDVPEPELTLVINGLGEIVGYTAGNDVSSRSIEGENPLYLPQAKSYDGSCAIGPAIVLGVPESLDIRLEVTRGGEAIFQGETSTQAMKRTMQDLVGYLFRELSFPYGAFLMTGTGIVPPHPFTLQPSDVVKITVGELELVNSVANSD